MITSFENTRSDFKIFWNVQNVIWFFIVNYDGRRQTIPSGRQFKIVVSNPNNGQVLINQVLNIVDASQGQTTLTLSADQSNALPLGNLTYSILMVENGVETLMYTDRDHGPQAGLEVRYGPIPAQPEPVTILRSSFNASNGLIVSGSIAGPIPNGNAAGVQTIQITGDALTGVVNIEAAMSTDIPSTDQDWASVDTVAISDLSGNMVYDFSGPYTWVRFAITETSGSLTQITYLN